MLLYHASNTIIENPSIDKCKRGNDFGKAFYLSMDRKQSIKLVDQKFKDGYVNIYDLDYEFVKNKYKYKKFELNNEFIKFLININSKVENNKLDIIECTTINIDSFSFYQESREIYKYLYGYFLHNLCPKELLSEILKDQLIYRDTFKQICIFNQNLINKHLKFKNYIRIKDISEYSNNGIIFLR